VARQIGLLERGETVVQETRGWNEAKDATFSQRSKEVEQEYRYFPEPDLVPLQIADEWIEEIRRTMPELPEAARRRFIDQYGLPPYDADVLTQTRSSATFFEEAAKLSGDAKAVSNWMMGDFARLLNAGNREIGDSHITPRRLADMLGLIADGTISGKMAKGLFERMFETGEDPRRLAEAEGPQIKDEGAVLALLDRVIADNSAVWTALRAGDEKKFGFLVGQVMKASAGKANPQEVNRLLREKMKAGD
jgi:aspartyl-tRNA(Asn)/glutamyl-tRNA(Gln) amidotransferase subunit B